MRKQKIKMDPSEKMALIIGSLIGIVLVISAALIFTPSSQQKITGYATNLDETYFCKDYDIEDMDDVSALQGCVNFKEIVLQEMQNLGMLDKGIDPLLIFSLAQQESSCNPQDARGLLMVDSCARPETKCEDERERIVRGLTIFNDNMNSLQQKGIEGVDLIKMTLFSYNRGIGTANKAVERIKLGESMEKAMEDACREVYDKDCKGTDDLCNKDKKGNDKCTDTGYGVDYPRIVLKKYQDYCDDLDGEIKNGIYDYQDAGLEIEVQVYGSYDIKPNFKIRKKHNLSFYEELKIFSEDVIKECETETPQTCIDEKMQLFNDGHDNIELKHECETPTESVFYDTLQNIQNCINTEKKDCVCLLTPTISKNELGDDADKSFVFRFSKLKEQEGMFYYEIKVEEQKSKAFPSSAREQPEERSDYVALPFELKFSQVTFQEAPSGFWGTITDFFKDMVKSYYGIADINDIFLEFYFIYVDPTDNTYKLAKGVDGKLMLDDNTELVDKTSCEKVAYEVNDYKFCAITSETYPTMKDDEVVWEPLKIKFSLYVPKVIPEPPVDPNGTTETPVETT